MDQHVRQSENDPDADPFRLHSHSVPVQMRRPRSHLLIECRRILVRGCQILSSWTRQILCAAHIVHRPTGLAVKDIRWSTWAKPSSFPGAARPGNFLLSLSSSITVVVSMTSEDMAAPAPSQSAQSTGHSSILFSLPTLSVVLVANPSQSAGSTCATSRRSRHHNG